MVMQTPARETYLDLVLDPRIRALSLCILLTSTVMSATAPYVSLVGIKELEIAPGVFSIILVASSVVTVSIAVLAGALSDAVSKRVVVALSLCVLGMLGYGSFFAIRSPLAFAIATVFLIPFSTAVYSQLFAILRSLPLHGSDRDKMTSLVRALFALPWIVVPPAVATYLIFFPDIINIYGISAVFAAFCALALVFFFTQLSIQNDNREKSGKKFVEGLARLKNTFVASRILILGLIYGSHKLHGNILSLIVVQHTGGSVEDVGRIAGLTAFMEIPMMLMWGSGVRRLGKSMAMALGGAVFSIYLMGLWFATDTSQIYFLVPLNACGAAVILSVTLIYVQGLLPDSPGLGSSLMSVTSFVGTALAGVVFGVLGKEAAYRDLALVGAAMAAAGAGILWFVDRPKPGARSVRQDDHP